VHGDVCLTTDSAGHQSGPLRTYSPFGEPLNATGAVDPDGVPDNQPGQMDYGWLGQHQRPYEHAGALTLVQPPAVQDWFGYHDSKPEPEHPARL
jgi:hypothetical protein